MQIRDEALFAAIGSQVEIALFRIVQEALSNVMRHAQASAVELEFHSDARAVYVSISDNGVGITPQQQRKKQCFGLIGIRERVRALDGQVEIGAPAVGHRLPSVAASAAARAGIGWCAVIQKLQ